MGACRGQEEVVRVRLPFQRPRVSASPRVILLLLELGRQDQTLRPALSCVCVRG